MDVSSIVGSFRKGLKLISGISRLHSKVQLSFVSNTACHSHGNLFIESINHDDFKNAVLQIIVGPEKSRDDNLEEDILELVGQIHGKLEDSPMEIMPFIKSCTRNAVFIRQN